jgi:hypothetical protein
MQNVPVLMKYLEDNTLPSKYVDIAHPWAAGPKTLGSIATIYLSILFMRDLNSDETGYDDQETRIQKCIDDLKKLKSFQVFERNLNHAVLFLIRIEIGCSLLFCFWFF